MTLTTWIHYSLSWLKWPAQIYFILNISHDKKAKYITLTSKGKFGYSTLWYIWVRKGNTWHQSQTAASLTAFWNVKNFILLFLNLPRSLDLFKTNDICGVRSCAISDLEYASFHFHQTPKLIKEHSPWLKGNSLVAYSEPFATHDQTHADICGFWLNNAIIIKVA